MGSTYSHYAVQPVRSKTLYFWIIRNYGAIDPAILNDTGLNVRHGIVVLVRGSLLLISWSWISGFVLGSLARRTIPVNGALFCLVLLFGELLAAPKYRDVNGALAFYSVMLTLILPTVLVLLPTLWGMHQGLQPATRPLVQTILWAVAVVTALAARNCFRLPFEASLHLGPNVSTIMGLLLLAVYWPVGYMLTTAIWRRWRGKTASV